MKLERARELYSDYVEGTLTPAMRLALEQHFESGSDARADFEAFTKVFTLLKTSPQEELDVPLGFRAKIMELAEAEQARRPAASRNGFSELMRGWFDMMPRRQLAAGAFSIAAVAIVAGMWLHPVASTNRLQTSSSGSMVPSFSSPVASVSTTIQGVTPIDSDGGLFYNFRIHLPSNVKSASVNAYVITSTDQILDPVVRRQEATPALKMAQSLTNDEQMQIPVGFTRQSSTGSTLTMFVQWTPDDGSASGAQVVFTPLTSDTAGEADAIPASDGNFYDMLKSVAAVYHVTIIADAMMSPTTAVSSWTSGDDVLTALQTVAKSSGYDVRALSDSPNTYQVYRK